MITTLSRRERFIVQVQTLLYWKSVRLLTVLHIETRRHTFSGEVLHETHGSVNVLNLVEGDEAVVESVDGSFAPFVVHYGETFRLRFPPPIVSRKSKRIGNSAPKRP